MELPEGKILIVDDDRDVLETARLYLKQKFSLVETLDIPGSLQSLLSSQDYDAILLDMNFSRGEMDGSEGIKWLKYIKSINPETVIIMITAYGDINLAVEAMKEGATDFILKPWKNEKLYGTIRAALELKKSRSEFKRLKGVHEKVTREIDKGFEDFIGESPAINRVRDLIARVAATDANVLILGENGTGKELVARALHKLSNRDRQDFIRVDLGSIAESLFESELFGHVRGAYTDARHDRIGCFELAHKGTLFLDEIGNLTMTLQAKLLTAIQNREIRRVGSNKTIPVNVRLITATNQPVYDLAGADKPGFRRDLLYRINTVEIQVPPLRKRIEDIPLLTDHFLRIYGRKYGKTGLRADDVYLQKLMSYEWPGNIRELQHAIEKAVILSEGDTLPEDSFAIRKRSVSDDITDPSTLENMEMQMIIRSIGKHAGNLTRVAGELGITRATLYRKIDKYGI